MRWKRVETGAAPAYVLVFDPGDEAIGRLTAFAADQHLTGAQITAVGAFERATIGWFDRNAKDYRRIQVGRQCEVLSLVGDVALAGDDPKPHIHAVLGLPDGSTRGGHLMEGHVWPTLEMIIWETPADLRKTYHPDIGLALIDLR